MRKNVISFNTRVIPKCADIRKNYVCESQLNIINVYCFHLFDRQCNNPTPINGGATCSGSSTDDGTCNTGVNCPSKTNLSVPLSVI